MGSETDHEPEQARAAGERFASFTRRLLVLAALFAVLYAVLAAVTGRLRLLGPSAVIAAFVGVCAFAYRLGLRGETRRAALLVGYALVGVAVIGCAIVPLSYSINILVCAMAVAAVLDHVDERDLRRLTAVCLLAITAITSFGVLFRDALDLPLWARAASIILSTVAACYLMLLLLWQHSTRMRQLVRDANERLEQLTVLQSQLVERERLSALGEAAAVVAHEVRNPLGVIVNVVELLRKEPGLREEARELLVMQRDEAQRLDRLVGDLLVLARPLEPRCKTFDTVPLLAHAIDAMRPIAEKAGVSMTLDADAAVPMVCVDPDHLQLALANLLQNAIDASPRGSDVHVSARASEGRVSIAVEDNGPGIREDLLPKIFEPFFTTRPTGSGLGLAIVNRVVKAHHGEVCVSNVADRGARFELRFAEA